MRPSSLTTMEPGAFNLRLLEPHTPLPKPPLIPQGDQQDGHGPIPDLYLVLDRVRLLVSPPLLPPESTVRLPMQALKSQARSHVVSRYWTGCYLGLVSPDLLALLCGRIQGMREGFAFIAEEYAYRSRGLGWRSTLFLMAQAAMGQHGEAEAAAEQLGFWHPTDTGSALTSPQPGNGYPQ